MLDFEVKKKIGKIIVKDTLWLCKWCLTKAVKKYIETLPTLKELEYRIVRGVGYWIDLYYFVIEVWVRQLKKLEEVK